MKTFKDPITGKLVAYDLEESKFHIYTRRGNNGPVLRSQGTAKTISDIFSTYHAMIIPTTQRKYLVHVLGEDQETIYSMRGYAPEDADNRIKESKCNFRISSMPEDILQEIKKVPLEGAEYSPKTITETIKYILAYFYSLTPELRKLVLEQGKTQLDLARLRGTSSSEE